MSYLKRKIHNKTFLVESFHKGLEKDCGEQGEETKHGGQGHCLLLHTSFVWMIFYIFCYICSGRQFTIISKLDKKNEYCSQTPPIPPSPPPCPLGPPWMFPMEAICNHWRQLDSSSCIFYIQQDKRILHVLVAFLFHLNHNKFWALYMKCFFRSTMWNMPKLPWEVTLGIGEGLKLNLLHPGGGLSPTLLLKTAFSSWDTGTRLTSTSKPITQTSRMLTVHMLLQIVFRWCVVQQWWQAP